MGFVLIGLSSLFMYFEVQTDGLYERMKYPVIIRSAGMMLLYSLTAVHANQRMPYKYLSTWICIMLTVRMVLGPGAGTAIYTNVMQHRQQHYVTRFAHDMDQLNTEVAGKPAEPRIESSGNVGAEKPAEIITGKKKPIDHTAVAMTGEHG